MSIRRFRARAQRERLLYLLRERMKATVWTFMLASNYPYPGCDA